MMLLSPQAQPNDASKPRNTGISQPGIAVAGEAEEPLSE